MDLISSSEFDNYQCHIITITIITISNYYFYYY